MRPSHLHYLLEIEKQRSISSAAQTIYIGQSTLSAILNKIEDELGFQIFQRTHTGMVVTPEGEEALVLIREMASCLDEIEQLKANTLDDDLPVELLCSPTISSALAVPLSNIFRNQVPNCSLAIHEGSESQTKNQIMRGKANIALVYLNEKSVKTFTSIATKYQLQIKHLFRDQFYLLMSRMHPMASLQTVDLAALCENYFAMLPKYAAEGSKSNFIQKIQAKNHYTVFSNMFLVKKAVLTHNMLSILRGLSVFHDTSIPVESFHSLPVGEQLPLDNADIYLIHRNMKDLRHSEKVLVKSIEAYFAEIFPRSAK